MTAPLEGAALFDAAQVAMGNPIVPPMATAEKWLWSSVPAMLEWLRGRVDYVALTVSENGAMAATQKANQWTGGPDLPTALARLVMRVHELEQQP